MYNVSMTRKSHIAKTARNSYLGSRDFNGVPLAKLIDIDSPADRRAFRDLIKEGTLEIASEAWDFPYIKRLACPPKATQLTHLRKKIQKLICVYPTTNWMRRSGTKVDVDRPFTARLQLAEPQLTTVPFELAVLERYQEDPRYKLEMYNFGGHVTVSSEHYESEQMLDRDKVVLESFGYGRTTGGRPIVVAFLRYLAALSPEHQRHWEGHIVPEEFKIEGNYYNAAVLGRWPEHTSIHVAFLEEFQHINRLCSLMGRPPLFRNDFTDDRPRGFGLILRPTRRNYGDFIHLLDKMISENINRKFFVGTGLTLFSKTPKQDGTVESHPKGSLALLEEWLNKYVRFRDAGLIAQTLYPLKLVHQLRHPLAHMLQNDGFDPRFHRAQQRRLIRTYRALQGIRLIFSSHPAAKTYRLPSFLEQESIALL
jgi:hypothetical protein